MKTYLKKSLTIAILAATFSLCLNFYAITANGEYTQKTKENGIYKIAVGSSPDKVIEIAGSNKNNNAKVDIWSYYQNADAQKFYFEYQKEGFYKITAMHTGKSLTVENNKIEEGAKIVQSEYTGEEGQKWIFKDSKKNGWIISPLSNPDLLITINEKIENGSILILSSKEQETPTNNQMYYLCNINEQERNRLDGIYKIAVGCNSSKVIEVAGSNKSNNAKVDIWSYYQNADAQKFYFEYKEGFYKITAMHTGKSLTVENNKIEEKAKIVQTEYTGEQGQKWIFKDSKKNGWIISPLSNPELSITVQGTIENGAILVLSSTEPNNNQMYYTYNISENEKTRENGTYKIAVGCNSSKVIEVAGSSMENNAKIDIWSYYQNAYAQKFNFEYTNGFYKITAKHTGKSLTVQNNEIKEGTKIVQSEYIGQEGQKWLLKDSKKNGWIISPLSKPDLSITVQGTIENGSILILSQTQNNDNQMFYTINLSKNIKEGTYGKSGLMYKGTGGYDLKYYQIGKGSKHLILNFSIHGFEDSYSNDGGELTYMANEFFKYLKTDMPEDLVDKWTVYIIPVSNPDGQYNGWTNNGPGRTSVYSLASGHKGIDMNRCFPVGFKADNSSRNYTGTEPLQAYEARALREFILNNQGSENVVIDVHGWLNETIGDNYIGTFYRNEFSMNTHIGTYGKGYFIQWAKTVANTRSMLLELPEVKSHNELLNKNYVNKFNRATMNLLRSY